MPNTYSSDHSGRHPPPRPRRRISGFLLRWALLVGVAVGLAGALYGVHLDRVVRAKFEGKRWALPARVFARPLEIYVDRPLTPEQLDAELARLNYRQVTDPTADGTYSRDGGRFVVHTRSFRFWDGEEPGRLLELDLKDAKVAALRDAGDGSAPALVRLEAALIASIYPTHNEDRVLVKRKDLPDLLVRTLLAVEDRSFFSHSGIDPRGIIRAGYHNLRAGSVVEGASTLTQQLVKNFYLTADRTMTRKLNEAYMALLLEWRYNKDDILEAYANEIYLGQDGSRGIHGFGLASSFFFNRDLDELGIAEAALLVGLVQAPSSLDPRRFAEAALKRRNLVIDVMVRDGVIGAADGDLAKSAPLGLRDGGGRPTGEYPDYIQLVRRQLQRDYRDEDLRSEGLRVFTTLDPLIQSAVEAALPKRLRELEKSHGMRVGTLETAAVVTSVTNGEVLALAGGRQAGYAGFNRALDTVRSIGSLVKPAVYLAALSNPKRYTLTTNIPDQPYSLRIGGDLWSPQNYDHSVHGSVPLYQALAHSWNLATVNLGMSIGVKEVAETLYRLGAQRRIVAVPAMMLGSVSLSPLEVAQIYQTIGAGGYRAPLRAIREVMDVNGRPLNRYPLAVEAVVDPRAAYLTGWAMQQVVRQGTAKWLGNRLPSGLTMAGKTGTTDDGRDSWFAGFSGDKVAVVWMGRDDYKPTGFAGGTGALRVWAEFMLAIPNEPLTQSPPEGVVLSGACGQSGIPYIVGSGPAGGGCADKADTRSAAKRSDAPKGRADEPPQAPAAARPAAVPAPTSAPKPKPQPQPKPQPPTENLFLSNS
ncbi:penicillin-binding protein 1B [Candidatus Thiodictyon syntrophicum]|jgi:penicillin-binding protein 1B|uniref:Penicillin-binding protein 1B n=1 Tax=Candidatus Thiodictyon syntrophicum TaxID=1166950 RepID=A0A2K8U5T5_9GAMM|nr:penicillin-binding protein 1B [Candidatus Thiodictyon syntrophicum]AUB80940.1 penicillin-binding protein 1B [Candidatus Thiodictyon syntrophicum]